MILIRKIKLKEIKYCTHCDARARFVISIDNPEIIQHSPVACLCERCMTIFKEKVNTISPGTLVHEEKISPL
jgi:hypothetical protein